MRSNLGLDERATGTGPRAECGRTQATFESFEEERRPRAANSARRRVPFAILASMLQARVRRSTCLDIIASVKLPKATAYRLVDWFVTQGYLAREPGRRRLIVGPKLTDLAFGALSSSMRHDTPHVVLQRLVHTLNETCNIGTLLNGEVVYLDRVEAEHWPLRPALHQRFASAATLQRNRQVVSGVGRLAAPQAASCKVWNCGGIQITPSPTAARLDAELRQILKGAGFFRSARVSRRCRLHGRSGDRRQWRDARCSRHSGA